MPHRARICRLGNSGLRRPDWAAPCSRVRTFRSCVRRWADTNRRTRAGSAHRFRSAMGRSRSSRWHPSHCCYSCQARRPYQYQGRRYRYRQRRRWVTLRIRSRSRFPLRSDRLKPNRWKSAARRRRRRRLCQRQFSPGHRAAYTRRMQGRSRWKEEKTLNGQQCSWTQCLLTTASAPQQNPQCKLLIRSMGCARRMCVDKSVGISGFDCSRVSEVRPLAMFALDHDSQSITAADGCRPSTSDTPRLASTSRVRNATFPARTRSTSAARDAKLAVASRAIRVKGCCVSHRENTFSCVEIAEVGSLIGRSARLLTRIRRPSISRQAACAT
jgi:hypothetical protein